MKSTPPAAWCRNRGPLFPAAVCAALVSAALLAGMPGGAGRAIAEEPQHRHGDHDATSTHPFTDAERWSNVFDSPDRAEWQKPAAVAAALDIEPGMVVADLGAGTGYFLEHLSREAGPRGMVLAVDTETDMVAYMARRMVEAGVENVVPVLALPADPFLPKGRVDRILIVNTYHHINDRLDYFARLRDAMTPGGRLAIVDFLKKPLPVGPPMDHKLESSFVVEEMLGAGWKLADEKKELLPYQYFLVFEPLSD